jgi:hypothetical protein
MHNLLISSFISADGKFRTPFCVGTMPVYWMWTTCVFPPPLGCSVLEYLLLICQNCIRPDEHRLVLNSYKIFISVVINNMVLSLVSLGPLGCPDFCVYVILFRFTIFYTVFGLVSRIELFMSMEQGKTIVMHIWIVSGHFLMHLWVGNLPCVTPRGGSVYPDHRRQRKQSPRSCH